MFVAVEKDLLSRLPRPYCGGRIPPAPAAWRATPPIRAGPERRSATGNRPLPSGGAARRTPCQLVFGVRTSGRPSDPDNRHAAVAA